MSDLSKATSDFSELDVVMNIWIQSNYISFIFAVLYPFFYVWLYLGLH